MAKSPTSVLSLKGQSCDLIFLSCAGSFNVEYPSSFQVSNIPPRDMVILWFLLLMTFNVILRKETII